jgi:CDGSH-type Zn-finger protein
MLLKGTFLNRNEIVQYSFHCSSFMKNIVIPVDMSKTKLTINNNGSVKIEGDFEIVDRNGDAYGLQGRTVLSICRCGLSKNKPFCDGSHNGHFEHEATAFDLPPKKV